MSDSSKQYSIQINTEVTGEESVEKLNSTIDETTTKFTRLQLQIKETKTALQEAEAAGDNIKFKRLKAELDELEDSFEINRMKSQQLDDQLQNMPGTLGNVGSSIKQVDGVMKMLSANPILLVLGLVAGAFMLVKKSLESTKEGTAALTRVTDGFGSIIKPIFGWISSIAVPVITKFAEGIEWLSSALGNVKEPITDVTEAMKKQAETFATAKSKYEEDLKTYNSYINQKKEILANDRISEEERTAWLKENEFKKNKFVSDVLNESTKTYREFLKKHNEEVDKINKDAENKRKSDLKKRVLINLPNFDEFERNSFTACLLGMSFDFYNFKDMPFFEELSERKIYKTEILLDDGFINQILKFLLTRNKIDKSYFRKFVEKN